MTIDREKLLKIINKDEDLHLPCVSAWATEKSSEYTAKNTLTATKLLAAILIELQDLNEQLKGGKQ